MKTVKSRMGLNKRLHYTPLVPLIGGFHVTSSPPCWWTVNKIKCKSSPFLPRVLTHFASKYPTLSPLRPDTTKTLTILMKTETKTQLRRRKVTLTYFTGGRKLFTKRELLKTYQSKDLTNF